MNRYAFSFTGASALREEAEPIAEVFLKYHDWDKVQIDVFKNNVLSKKKTATVKRKFAEIRKRLLQLNEKQLRHLTSGDANASRIMVLLSVVKTYGFVNDFITEVLRNKMLLYDRHLHDLDYVRFVESKKVTHPELERLTEKTQDKVKQLVFKMLEQLGLIDSLKTKMILRPHLDSKSLELIIADNPIWLRSFLFSEADIKGALQKVTG